MSMTIRSKLAILVQNYLRQQKPNHFSRKLIENLRNIGPLRAVWRRYFRAPSLDYFDFENYLKRGAQFASMEQMPISALMDLHNNAVLFANLAQIAHEYEKPYVPIAMKIIIVNCSLAAGGAEKQVVNTLLGLKKHGHDVAFIGEFIGHRDDLDFHLLALKQNDIVYFSGRNADLAGNNIYKNISPQIAALISHLSPDEIIRLLGMVEHFRELRPQIVHLWQDQTSVLHGIAALIARVPRIIVSGRNINPTHFSFNTDWLKPGYLALADAKNVIFTNNSKAGAKSYEEWLGFKAGRIIVLRNGVDFSKAKTPNNLDIENYKSRLGVPANAKIICGIFRMSDEKRPMLWLECAKALVNSCENLVFIIAGDGELTEQVKAKARELGIENHTIFLGETQEIPLLLSACELLLLTSQYEGTPNVILEANWFNRPVVTTRAGGAEECVESGITGFISPSDDAETIAGEVKKLMHLKATNQIDSAEFHKFISRKFGIERMKNETIELYFSK